MDQNVIMKGILDSYPYPIVFCRQRLCHPVHEPVRRVSLLQRAGGYAGLIGKSIFDCHSREESRTDPQRI